MKRKHAITTTFVFSVLAILIYLQVRHWHNFDWAKFRAVTSGVNVWSLLLAVGFTWLTYVLRGIRWALFLRPTKEVPLTRLIAAQFIGFTGLALLGRPGEFVRPYLIARQEELSFSSQLAIWFVERVFDVSSVALLLGGNLLIGRHYEQYPSWVNRAGFGMAAFAIALAVLMTGLRLKSEFIANSFQKLLKPISKKFADAVCTKLRGFGEGLHTLKNYKAFLAVLLLSVGIWLSVAESYIHVLHAYPESVVTATSDSGLPKLGSIVRLHHMHIPDVLIVMSASMFGSVFQLPGVGGGSQLFIISILSHLFAREPYNITPELALSCGMMLWLVTFMSVIPIGLLLAHFNRISLRAVGEASEEVAEEEIAHPHAGPQQP
jgi:glycosyltransferase 2 family protein